MLQRELQQTLRARALATHDEVARLIRPIDPEQLNRRPRDGGWSVGQVLEHLCVSVEIYTAPMQAMLRSARVDAAAPLREWKPLLFGRLLVQSLSTPRKLSTPKGMAPALNPRGGVGEAFLGIHAALVTSIDDSATFDWNALRMSSPVVPRILQPLARLNLGDVFSVFVVHAERHARQMERVVATFA
ncbi:MAG: DinB family protein [Gemmatimonadaceae bacterium]